MYKDKTICVVVPAHNEAHQIAGVIETMPDFVDHIVVVDDASTDGTASVVRQLSEDHPRLALIVHEENQGVGGAIATGYRYARDSGYDIAVVMAGDGQMDPADLPAILDPVAEGRADYSKANRLVSGKAYQQIPKARYFGNAVLSLLTKIASGYWHIADSQSGYTAASRRVLETIDWDTMYKRYGQPNDLLIKLNVHNMRVADVPSDPVYNVGERSGLKIPKVILPISMLLLRGFLWRMKEKYIVRDFHPLVFFYFLGISMLVLCAVFSVRLLWLWHKAGHAPDITLLIVLFSFTTGLQSIFFAMWFDMENGKDLRA